MESSLTSPMSPHSPRIGIWGSYGLRLFPDEGRALLVLADIHEQGNCRQPENTPATSFTNPDR